MSFDDSIDDCCCEPEPADWSDSEPVSYAADDDLGYDDGVDVETAVGYDVVTVEPVADDDTVDTPAAAPAAVAPSEPTISATWGPGVEQPAAPVAYETTATIGGDTGPGSVIEPGIAPTTAFVGGGAGPGFEIVPADQPAATYDPAVSLGVVGGSWTPGFEAQVLGGATLGGDTIGAGIDAANDAAMATFAHQAGLDQIVPAAPRPMTANEQLAANILMPELQRQLSDAQRGLQDTMSPLYHAGDDIDPDSLFYNDRP